MYVCIYIHVYSVFCVGYKDKDTMQKSIPRMNGDPKIAKKLGLLNRLKIHSK